MVAFNFLTLLPLFSLFKDMIEHQTELNSQKNQLEKLSAARLELEEKIMSFIQQHLTHSKAASHSQNLTSKLLTRKMEKVKIWLLMWDNNK